MTRRLLPISIALLLALGLAACGTKGPLVLPDAQAAAKKKPATTTQPAPAPADAAKGDAGKQP
jgi:predicted small lipoprotein YifL